LNSDVKSNGKSRVRFAGSQDNGTNWYDITDSKSIKSERCSILTTNNNSNIIDKKSKKRSSSSKIKSH